MPTIEFQSDELRPLIQEVVEQVLASMETDSARANGRLSFPEVEAAALLGVARHVLRDARLRGEIEASTVGSRIVYTKDSLLEYLQRNRWHPKR